MPLKLLHRLKLAVLEIRIYKKWREDRRHLPLTAEHKELYGFIHRLCWRELRDFPNLVNCRDFNDRIQWLKLFDQDPEIIRCSDKVTVRDYVAERVGPQYLTKLYQVHERFDDIDFDSLPSAFVIKANHDSGTVILVKDKAKLDKAQAKEKMDSALSRPYGWENGEWAYSYIEPRVLVEELLDTTSGNAPADYKFHCSEGHVLWLQYIYDSGQNRKEVIVDPEGCVTEEHFSQNMEHSNVWKKPVCWQEMLDCAKKLSADWKYVRVDLFQVRERVVVGELTFFPLMGCYKTQSQTRLGRLLRFDRKSVKRPISLSASAGPARAAFSKNC